MADDFIRIPYKRETGGKAKRTTISIDPLLFEIFSLVRGGISEARAVVREWAMEADTERNEANWRIGNSRIVQQRMSQEILEMVKHGLVYQKMTDASKRKPKTRGTARGKGAAPAPSASQQLPAVTGHLEVEHG